MQKSNRIFGKVDLSPAWFKKALGIEAPHPFKTDIDLLVEHEVNKSKMLHEHFPDLLLGEANPKAAYPIVQYDRRLVIASAFGGVEPVWKPDNASFWVDKHVGPWGDIKTANEVTRIKIPDWETVPLVQQMLEKWDQIQKKTRYPIQEISEWMEFDCTNPYTQRTYRFSDFPTFIDLGHFLCGSTEFFTILAGEPDLARAMLEKCFELSTSFSDFRRKVYDRNLEAISSLGGDNSCNLSPDMYRQYAMAHDAMMIDRYGNLPCNLHSCGASSHLYDVWGTYPNKNNIVVMQTRGIPGELYRLRKALPDTLLQITIHQPQFDFENEAPDKIYTLVEHYARQADFHNLELVVVINDAGEHVDRNIRAFYRAIETVNSCQ
jgi:hypothetical protein